MKRRMRSAQLRNKRVFVVVASLCAICVCVMLCIIFIVGRNTEVVSTEQTALSPEPTLFAETENNADSDSAWIEKQEYNHTEGNVVYTAEVADPNVQSVFMPKVIIDNNNSGTKAKCLSDTLAKIDSNSNVEDWIEEVDDEGKYYDTKSNRYIKCLYDTFTYITEFGKKIDVMYINQLELVYFYPQTEFSWKTRDDCAKEATEIVESLGILGKVDANMPLPRICTNRRIKPKSPLWTRL